MDDFSIIKRVDGKAKYKMQFYGPGCLNSDGSVMTFGQQMAVVSHYLHNRCYGTKKPYESKALTLMQDMGVELPSDQSSGVLCESGKQLSFFNDLFDVPFKCCENPKFTFIDLFAGIGGFRMAMQSLGGRCVFSSEWYEQAQMTYLLNYGEVPFGDITKEETKGYIPDGFDVLCAGFPCQAFSLAGKRRGFEETLVAA